MFSSQLDLEIIYFIILSSLFFVVKLYFASKEIQYRKFATDLANEFVLINEIRKKGFKFPKSFDQYEIDEALYPPLFQWFVSFLPQKYLVRYSYIIPIIVDYVLLLILLFSCLVLFANKNYIVISGLLFIFHPIWHLWKNRSYSFSSRAPGCLFYTIVIFASIQYCLTYEIIYFLLALLFTIFTLLTHRFASQTLFFTNLIFTLIVSNTFLIIFALGIILSQIVTFGYYSRIFRGHIGAFYYFKIFDNRYGEVSGESEIRKLMMALINPIKNNLRGNPLFSYFKRNLILVSLIFYPISMNNFNFNFVSLFDMIFLWSFTLPFLMIFTSFHSTRFLGRPERYLEYGILPLIILSIHILDIGFSAYSANYFFGEFFQGILFFSILLGFYYTYKEDYNLRNGKKSNLSETEFLKRSDSYDDLFKFLNNLQKGLVLCTRINFSHHVALNSKHKVLYNMAANDISSVKVLDKIIDNFPLPNIDFIIENYKIDYYIVEKEYIQKRHLENKFLEIEGMHQIYDNAFYSVHGVKTKG